MFRSSSPISLDSMGIQAKKTRFDASSATRSLRKVLRRIGPRRRAFLKVLFGAAVAATWFAEQSVVNGQVVTFDTSGTTSAGSIAATFNATQKASGVSGTPQLSRTTLNNTGGAAGSFFSVGSNITNTLNLNTNYVGFTVAPSTGNVLFATGINWTSQGSGTAPNSYATAYSTDGFTTSNQTLFTGTTSTGVQSRSFDITDLITNDTLSVRLYNYGATSIGNGTSSATGSFRTITPTVTGSTVSTSSGAISLAAATEIRNSTALTLGGVISGGFGITKTGAGTLTLGGANLYNGGTTVNGGALNVTGSLASGSALTVSASGTANFSNVGQTLGAVSNANTATNALNFSAGSGTVTLASLSGAGNTRFGSAGIVTDGISTGTVTSVGALNANVSGGSVTAGGLLTGTISAGTVSAGSLSSSSVTGGTNNISGAANITTLNGGTTTVGGVATIGTFTSGTANLNGSTSAITTLNGGSVNLGPSTTLTVSNGSTSGVISGATGSLVKDSAGTLTLSGNNTYGGTTEINEGTLQIGNGETSGSLGAGVVSNFAQLTFNRSDDFTVANDITGGGRVTKLGAGTMTITGSISNQMTTVTSGTLQIGDGDSGSIDASVENNGVLAFNRSDDISFFADISGTGSVTKLGTGTLTLEGANTYSGNTVINNGILQLATADDRLPTGTVVSLGQAASANLGTLDLNGLNQTIAGLNSTIGTNATSLNNTVTSATAATLTIGGSGIYSYGDGTNSNSGVITGEISLVKDGLGTQILGDANTYSGTTQINQGTLQIGNGGTSGSLGMDDVVNEGTLSFNRSNAFTVANAISGNGNITKDGAGTLTLTGSNSYEGTTTVSGGTLLINGTQTGMGSVTVGSNATLGGSGSVAGAVTIEGGGTLSPGNSPGIFTANAELTFDTNSNFSWELISDTVGSRGTAFDGVNGNGSALVFSGAANSQLVFNSFGSTVNFASAFWDTNQSWLVFNNFAGTGVFTGSINAGNDAFGNSFASTGGSFAWSREAENLFLRYDITAVPEPTSLIAAIGMGLCGTWYARRRIAKKSQATV